MLIRYVICKTVVPYPENHRYVLFEERDVTRPVRFFGSLAELAQDLRTRGNGAAKIFLKNDVPGHVVWFPNSGDKARGDDVVRCERLSDEDVTELVRRLQA